MSVRAKPGGHIAILSGVLFGGVHYFGIPGGLIGVALAGFLGWLLTKSITKTRGVFWAWSLHFLQDLVIFIRGLRDHHLKGRPSHA